jgi:hypothetical protein
MGLLIGFAMMAIELGAAAQMQVLVSSLCMYDDARSSGHRTDAIGMIEV